MRVASVARVAFTGWLALVLIVLLAPADALTPGESVDLLDAPFADKLVHFTAFAVLGALARPAFPSAPPRALVAAFAVLALATELVQAAVPGRSPDTLDLAADLLGLAAGVALVRAPRAERAG